MILTITVIIISIAIMITHQGLVIVHTPEAATAPLLAKVGTQPAGHVGTGLDEFHGDLQPTV